MPNSSDRRRSAVGAVRASAAPGARSRRGDPVWARILVMFGALLMLASGGIIVGGKVLVGAATKNIDSEDLIGSDAVVEARNAIEGPLNVLLVGIDQRPLSETEPMRSDTIIILHVPAAHDRAYLVSLPRDLLVSIPASPETGYSGGREKINAAFKHGSQNGGGRRGGFQLLAKTITGFTGIRFNAGAIINFSGFQQVTEELGGVHMCVDERVVSHHLGRDKNGRRLMPYTGAEGDVRDWRSTPDVYEPGCRDFTAEQALDYVRQRKGLSNGDYTRQLHQQHFIKALLKKAKQQGVTSNPAKALQVINAAGKALTVDTNGVAFEDWAFTLRGITDNELVMLKTNGGKVNPIEVPGVGSSEQLTDESRAMFAALQADALAVFAGQHPHFVAADSAPPGGAAPGAPAPAASSSPTR
ncbi:MAG TPA: LCP family protein [Micromonosporaceae bacterium]|nr:LCP family protein [Micromonosporaceae bacterium]